MSVYNGIFHVTSDLRVNRIGRLGLIPGSPMLCTDKGKCAAITEDEAYVLEEDDAVSETMDAEELANRVMNEKMPERFREAGASREAIYFYPSRDRAKNMLSAVNAYSAYFVGNKGCIVEVASKKIPCRNSCVVAPARYADDVFAKAANARSTYDFEKSEEGDQLDRSAAEFWEEAKLLPEADELGRTDEIFCPCRIPPDAIKGVHGCPVKRLGKQYTMHAFPKYKREPRRRRR